MRKIALLLIFLNYSSFLLAQTAKVYSNEFLNIGVDARSLAMGNAVVATTSDVTSGYWNPSGLAKLSSQQIGLMHASYFANIAQYDYMAYAKRLDDQTGVAVSLIRFGVDNIMNTTQLIDDQGNVNYDRITYFSAADYALNFSIGRQNVFVEGLNVGATAKLIYRHIGDFASGYGFGFDVGAQYQVKQWQLGLMLRDITTTFNYWSVNQEVFDEIAQSVPGQNQTPPNSIELTLPKMQMGVARNFTLNDHLDLLTELDLNARFFKMHTLVSFDFISIDPALGLSFSYYKMAFVRLGVNNFRQEQYFDDNLLKFQPNAGLGFKYKGIELAYALTNIGSNGFYSHIFSLQVNLDKFIKQKNK
ncbi:MAG TPA: PorV/PorQ family protein [Flavobacteriales bacterium]|nr:PorV/PorQ family protein [Flavobacteriales bacterium]